jgi:transmembrane sensor
MNASATQVDKTREAANWYVRLADQASEDDLREWVEWCAADPANLKEFERIRATWQGFGRLAADVEPTLRNIDRRYPPARFRVSAIGTLAATIAAIAILSGLIAFMLDRDGDLFITHTYASEIGEVRNIALSDGSILTLNTDAQAKVRYSGKRREITLDRGQALFKVAKDASRPFFVYANSTTVKALGTTFMIDSDDHGTAVTLVEGKIAVEANAPGAVAKVINRLTDAGTDLSPQSLVLTAGQRLNVSGPGKHSAVEPISAAVIDRELAWRDGRLVYIDAPLSRVVADASRYSKRRIEISDPQIANVPYSGTIFTKSIDDWLQAVQTTFPVTITTEPERIIIRARAD